MNEKQLLIFLQQAFTAKRLGGDVIRAITPQMQSALQQVRQIVESLPDESLIRRIEWNKRLPEVIASFDQLNDQFFVELTTTMAEQTPQQVDNAVSILKEGSSPAQPLITPSIPDALNPDRAVSGLAASTQRWVNRAANTKFMENTIKDVFTRKVKSGGVVTSPYIKANAERINKIVQEGILQSVPTKEIADRIGGAELNRVKINGGEAYKRARREADTIAQTAISAYNNEINMQVWQDNKDAIPQWQWVATLDSATCPQCAPMDGQIKDNSEDFPIQPLVHPSCECRIMPYWEDNDLLSRPSKSIYDPDDPDDIPTFRGQKVTELNKQDWQDYLKSGGYATKEKYRGKRYMRRAKTVAPVNGRNATHADWLAKTNHTSQAVFFGGGNAGRLRAERFRKLIERSGDPKKALLDLLKTAKGDNGGVVYTGFKKLKDMPAA